jgi:hypothetical protein
LGWNSAYGPMPRCPLPLSIAGFVVMIMAK